MADDWPGEGFDPQYFQRQTWTVRAASWVNSSQHGFTEGNRKVVEQATESPESGLRVVINISADALVSFISEGRYRNLYESPVIGERPPPEASEQRKEVDDALAIGPHTYFGAAALGGVGVRYYGEYCMVLDLSRIDPDPQLFDRDSYDILMPPFKGHPDRDEIIMWLKGKWSADRHAIVLMKVMPEIVHLRRLVTAGTVSEAVLADQEFIEVHLDPRKTGGSGSFTPHDVEEVRQSPDEVAVAMRLREREASGERLADVEHEWLVRREAVERSLVGVPVPTRVVTLHGRGYQWT